MSAQVVPEISQARANDKVYLHQCDLSIESTLLWHKEKTL